MNTLSRALVVVGLALLAGACSSKPPTEPPRVADAQSRRDLVSGAVVGFHDRYDTHAWLGIPYAAPPVGALRWRAPQPAAAFAAPLQALRFGNICPQFWGFGAEVEGKAGQVVGDEDCLTLNVWAPAMGADAAKSKKLPVMFWIHGGGNTIGTSRSYPGYHLAADQQVVVVTINYRLNILGWFSHPAIRATAANPEDASGNFGTLDMIAALKWVQQNIAAFGGDPGNVTIFGESGGGRDVYVLLGTPLAKGLFHKAIVQSGMAATDPLSHAEHFVDDPEPGDAYSSGEILLLQLIKTGQAKSREEAKAKLAATSAQDLVASLRAKSLQDLYASSFENPGKVFGGLIMTPHHVRDGYVFPQESLLTLFADPQRHHAVPLIVGTTRDEGKMPMMMKPEYVRMAFGRIPLIRDKAAFEHAAAYVSDSFKALSVDEPLAILTKNPAQPVFAYRFEWDDWPYAWLKWPVDLKTLMGAGHGLDVGYVFGDVGGILSMPASHSTANEPGRLALRKAMMNYWGQFAHTGAPGKGRDGRQVEWTPWRASTHDVMILDAPEDHGPRMASLAVSADDIKRRIAEDPTLADQAARCRLYVQVFLTGMQAQDFFDADEYARFGEGGCAAYPPFAFPRPYF